MELSALQSLPVVMLYGRPEFARTMGRVLGRPSFIPTPASAVRFALGELADAIILGGQRVVPTRATALGYVFKHETLEPALRDIYGRA